MSRTPQEEELFRYHKGRALKLAPTAAQRLFPEAYGGLSGFTPEQKAWGVIRNTPEAMVKLDQAKNGIKGAAHLHQAANYISRNGQLEVEDEQGTTLSKPELDEVMDRWAGELNLSSEDNPKAAAAARRIIFSAPKGTPPKELKDTVRELTQEVFARQGYSYVLVLHEHNPDHPDEPNHPHVHVLIKAVNERGRRLNIRKEDLRFLRERFAALAKEHGIELNATTRAARAQLHKAKTQAQKHSEERGDFSHPYAKEREEALLQAILSNKPLNEHEAKLKATATRSKVKDNLNAYAEELRRQGNKELADALQQYSETMSAEVKTSQEELLAQAQKVLRQRDAIRRRKAKEQHPQSQAQKWAIHRKKQQLHNRQEPDHEAD